MKYYLTIENLQNIKFWWILWSKSIRPAKLIHILSPSFIARGKKQIRPVIAITSKPGTQKCQMLKPGTGQSHPIPGFSSPRGDQILFVIWQQFYFSKTSPILTNPNYDPWVVPLQKCNYQKQTSPRNQHFTLNDLGKSWPNRIISSNIAKIAIPGWITRSRRLRWLNALLFIKLAWHAFYLDPSFLLYCIFSMFMLIILYNYKQYL